MNSTEQKIAEQNSTEDGITSVMMCLHMTIVTTDY